MKITPNISELYRLMKSKGLETVRQLSTESGIDCSILYGAFDRGIVSKETYWRLAKFFGCHIEDLQIPDYSK
ncbi:MAG: helix-turn-helix transcriptional regulator [Ruminococcus sp.]|nr:helix-turn-helix transcriptional regulator [Ruminococcus sp.]